MVSKGRKAAVYAPGLGWAELVGGIMGVLEVAHGWIDVHTCHLHYYYL